LSLDKKKIKIEVEDSEGGKYNLSLEGNMSKEKLLKVFDFMDQLNKGTRKGETLGYDAEMNKHEGLTSLSSKIWNIVENKFPFTSFTSSDIQEMYKEEHSEPIKLDVVATYLARYEKKRRLVRSKGTKQEWVYKVSKPSVVQNEQYKHEGKQFEVQGFSNITNNTIHAKNLNN